MIGTLPTGEPLYGPTTERIWSRLPEIYRTADAAYDWTFKRWLAAIGEQIGAVETLIERFDFRTLDEPGGTANPHSDLVDPQYADDAWIPWLSQLYGIPQGLTTQKARASMLATAAFKGGTKQAIIAAIQPLLTGTQSVTIYDHSNGGANLGTGNEWNILLVTRQTETPDGVDIVQAAIDAGAKPAGVILARKGFSTPWSILEAGLGPWANPGNAQQPDRWETLTWTEIEEYALNGSVVVDPPPTGGGGGFYNVFPGIYPGSLTFPGTTGSTATYPSGTTFPDTTTQA